MMEGPPDGGAPALRGYGWVLGGAVLGAVLGLPSGSLGFYLGLAVGALVELCIKLFFPDNRSGTFPVAITVMALGLVLGGIIGSVIGLLAPRDAPVPLEVALAGRAASVILNGALLGILIAVMDRVAVWFLFPLGAEEPQVTPDEPAPEEAPSTPHVFPPEEQGPGGPADLT